MTEALDFPALLRLIDDRSAAFQAALTAAPRLDLPVPTCPEWTIADLARHLGDGQRSWAATVTAGPAATARSTSSDAPAPQEAGALAAWFAASTRELLDALREAGPDRGCWTWWGGSQSPQTSGAVARHRLQEAAVHAYDAQLAAGTKQPLPAEVALDGVEEFLSTCCATPSPWPHAPTAFDFHASEGRSWRLTADGDGARVTRLRAPVVGAAVHGTASDLVLFMYDRLPAGSLRIDGDATLIDLLRAWEPE
ncbi:maleylpyruvate isomerase family mycothiol-dependent enzyme [Herbidospora daliensis]|uniref:maleylpyruvate isomerase family mycothiol-dependent enzyme n=1 Tax=Herbidospora daliensis TaxID=295585 RepID=UPI0007842030|nr:maleylpyruvate isomerase family mycothiol-dependent enzyme [Herbidospora daliensis]